MNQCPNPNCKMCENMNKSIINAHQRIDKKVSWIAGWSVIVILISIVGGMMAVLYAQNTKVSDKISDLNKQVAIVQTEVKLIPKRGP